MVEVIALLIAAGAAAVAGISPEYVVWAGAVAGLLVSLSFLSGDRPNR